MKKACSTSITACLIIGSFIFLCGIDACEEPRFRDNNDGTVTDTVTELVWLKDANCYGTLAADAAATAAAGLNSEECGLSDGSTEGDWRLPTKTELQGIGTDPPATWEYRTPEVAWTLPDAPFENVQSAFYWTGTPYPINPVCPYIVLLGNGYTTFNTSDQTYHVWPVRSDS